MRESLYCKMESESFMHNQYLSDLHSLTVVSYLCLMFYQYMIYVESMFVYIYYIHKNIQTPGHLTL